MDSKIERLLRTSQVSFQEIKHQSFNVPIRSPHDFAVALGYDIERITKSVFLRSKTRDKYVMAVCSCNQKLDLQELAVLAGVNKLEVADKEELSNLVGYPIFGVSSIGLSENIPVFFDASLLEFNTILAGSGESAVEIELAPADLAKISAAVIAKISI